MSLYTYATKSTVRSNPCYIQEPYIPAQSVLARKALSGQTHRHTLLFPWQTYRLSPKKVHSDLEVCQKMVKKM